MLYLLPLPQVLASKTAVCFLPRGGSSSSWWFFFCRRLLFSLFCLWFNSSCFILSNIAEYRIESLLNVLAFSMTHLTVLSALIDFFLVFMGSALLFIFLFLPSFEFSFPSVPHSFGYTTVSFSIACFTTVISPSVLSSFSAWSVCQVELFASFSESAS